MARPKLEVKHFIVCRAAPWEGPPGPRTPRTLEGVSYRIGVPRSADPPFEVGELWSYLRVFNLNSGEATVPFYLDLIWAPGSPQLEVEDAQTHRRARKPSDPELTMGKRRKSLNGPPPVSEADYIPDGEVGPAIYHVRKPPIKTYLRWNGSNLEIADSPTVASLIPASEEVAKLPRGAREAFAARCAARVAPLRPNATFPEAAAALVLAAATVETPIRRQLLCIRRDFDLLVRLAKQHGWTDETAVSPEVFGPMWPKSVAPEWAEQSAPPAKPDEPDPGTV